jgi:uncharacterized protein (TIGR00299 family) protein
MRLAYGELIGGLSGDMFVAALLHLGLPLKTLKAELKKLPGIRFELKSGEKIVHGIRATRFEVTCPRNEKPRSWKQIRALIGRSKLASATKATGLEIFARMAEAEAKIHGVAVDRVHFHEVGATDSIVDIMATAIGIDELELEELHFSAVPLGRGLTRSAHGVLPVPGPATLELLHGVPVFGVDVEGETVTPTGAAILRVLGKSFGPQPAMTIGKVGYGTGQKEFAHRPNLFRMSLGAAMRELNREEMLLVETNIDDMNPQLYDYVMERLFGAGARDVFLTPIQMKKNRPATLLSVICEPSDRDAIASILLQETTTLGVRYQSIARLVLKRKIKKLKTRFGEITVKLIVQPDGSHRAVPEYEDLKRIAALRRSPLKLIHDEVSRLLETT